jgi:hypothetical protein
MEKNDPGELESEFLGRRSRIGVKALSTVNTLPELMEKETTLVVSVVFGENVTY